MCPPAKACFKYTPNMNRKSWGGNLCTGMGWTPPCANCGLSESRHHFRFGDDEEMLGDFELEV